MIPIIRADFLVGTTYTMMEKTRAKLFQTPIDVWFEGRVKGQGKIDHFLFRNIPGKWLIAISDRQLRDYKIKKKEE